MKTDIDGCSTIPAGKEQYEVFTVRCGMQRVQYDYRTVSGELFSCIGKTLEECREKRSKWLASQGVMI